MPKCGSCQQSFPARDGCGDDGTYPRDISVSGGGVHRHHNRRGQHNWAGITGDVSYRMAIAIDDIYNHHDEAAGNNSSVVVMKDVGITLVLVIMTAVWVANDGYER